MIAILTTVIIVETVTLFVYGRPYNDKKILKTIENNVNSARLNECTNSIIYVADLPYITKISMSVLFKYYINDNGLVFRWSKGAKLIDLCFKEINNEN